MILFPIKKLDYFLGSNKQHDSLWDTRATAEKISKEESSVSLFDDLIFPKIKEGKKIA